MKIRIAHTLAFTLAATSTIAIGTAGCSSDECGPTVTGATDTERQCHIDPESLDLGCGWVQSTEQATGMCVRHKTDPIVVRVSPVYSEYPSEWEPCRAADIEAVAALENAGLCTAVSAQ